MAKIEFRAKLEYMGGLTSKGEPGNWLNVNLPKTASAKLGSRGRVAVKGTVNGFAFRTSAFPTGAGTHQIPVNAAMREGAGGIGAGDRASFVIEVDTAPRVVEVPAELKRAFAKSKAAKAAFEKLAPSHRKEIAGYVAEAKQPETRERRATQTVAALASGTWKSR